MKNKPQVNTDREELRELAKAILMARVARPLSAKDLREGDAMGDKWHSYVAKGAVSYAKALLKELENE